MARTLAPITSVADLAAFSGNITTDAELGRLEMVWKAVEAEIRRYCGQNIAQPADPYVDFLPEMDWDVPIDPLLQNDSAFSGYSYYVSGAPSFDGHVLALRQGLVRSITSVYVDTDSSAGTDAGDFPASTLLDASSYFLDVDEKDPSNLLLSRTGFVIRKTGNWPSRRRSVKVTYVAGLTGAEIDDEFSDIRLAVMSEVMDRYTNLSSIGSGRVKSERLGDWNVTYDVGTSGGEHSLSSSLRNTLQPFVRYRLG